MSPSSLYRSIVADDVSDLRFLLRTSLERSGHFTVVGEAANGRDAVAAAEEHRPDLALLDLSMPVMDGLEALPRIRAAVPECTVVVLSGFDREAMADKSLRAGAAAYLQKGLNPQDLIAQLLEQLDGRNQARKEDSLAASFDIPGMTFTLPGDLSSVRQARRFVQGALRDWSREEIADEAVLLTSELVTNAVVHARSEVRLTLVPFSDRLRVEVADTGPGALEMRDTTEDAVSGRGLLLVQEMSRTWGTSADESRKTVWFEL